MLAKTVCSSLGAAAAYACDLMLHARYLTSTPSRSLLHHYRTTPDVLRECCYPEAKQKEQHVNTAWTETYTLRMTPPRITLIINNHIIILLEWKVESTHGDVSNDLSGSRFK
jgi:hypothetical protein